MVRSLRPSVVVCVATVAMLLAGCGTLGAGGEPEAGGVGSWEPIPAGPLNPRESALGLWTGSEVLLVGGSDARPCPPGAECVAPKEPPLADGAAFDPRTGSWRRIADSPVPFEWAEGVVLGQTAYVWINGAPQRPGVERAFLAYRITDDRWEKLPLPSADPHRDYNIAAAGGRVVAYTGTDEFGESPDLLFDPRTGSWSELPPDPLSPSFDRAMAWNGRDLVLFDHELVPQPGAEQPAVTRAAAFDIETESWRRLPDSEILASGPWVRVGARLVNPMLGGADGGRVGNWGRTYPNGGILDPERGRWSELPNRPDGQDALSAGALTESGGYYFGYLGWILDATTDRWIEIPPLDSGGQVTGRTVVAAGGDLLVFGGVRWEDGLDGKLLNDAWIWSLARGG